MKQEIGIYLNSNNFVKAEKIINHAGKLILTSGNIKFYLMDCGCKLHTIKHENQDRLSIIVLSENDLPLAEDISNASSEK